MAVFNNRAMLTYNGKTTASNLVEGELVGALTASKVALASEYSPGQRVSYLVTLVNSGSSALTGLSVEDDLGGFETETGSTAYPLTYVEGSAALIINGVPQPAPTVSSGSGLIFTGIDVPALGSAVLGYTAEVNGFAPLSSGSSIVNTVSVTGQQISAPVTASSTVPAADEPVLSIVKALEPATVMENGSLTYTFTILNTGAAAAGAGDSVSVSDVFSPVLSGITATLDGTPLASPTGYTYDPVTGEFETAPGVITVPAAQFTVGPDGSVTTAPGKTVLTVSGSV